MTKNAGDILFTQIAPRLASAKARASREAAHALHISDSAMQSSKRILRVKILEFMGFDILAQVQRRPQWKQNLETIREAMACRVERRG